MRPMISVDTVLQLPCETSPSIPMEQVGLFGSSSAHKIERANWTGQLAIFGAVTEAELLC
jgi:hypothetical protein